MSQLFVTLTLITALGAANPPVVTTRPADESVRLFTVPAGFEVSVVAHEPDVINPIAMVVDDRGRLIVSEAHTYRWGPEASPVKPPSNPIVLLELDEQGKAHRRRVVAQGFEDPVMGLAIRGKRLWIAALNKLIVAELNDDGVAIEQKTIVQDVAKPWNPFGFYRVAIGPDGLIYLICGDHEIELVGADGTRVKTRGPTGALFRCHPDGTKLELVIQGMRAPFSFDFDPFGHLWVLSNGEGNPNRLLMAIPSVDYHFQTRHGDWAWLAGNHPWSPPVTEMQRGANTQVLCSLDGAFPATYWGSLLVANWGAHGLASVNHKIDLYQPDGKGGVAPPTLFLNGADPMFRPTQLVPDIAGNLYMLDWYGKDDENDLTGRIYKIAYKGSDPRYTATLPKTLTGGAVNLDPEQRSAITGLFSPRSTLRARAADFLVAHPEADVLAALRPILSEPAGAFETAQILWVLRRLATPEASQLIALTATHPDANIRAMALRLLRDLQAATLETIADKALSDMNPEVCVEAALSLKEPARVVTGLLTACDRIAGTDRRLMYQCAVELSRRMTTAQWLELLQNAKSRDDARSLVGWIALDVGLLEAINPGARETFRELLSKSDASAALMELAERWATPADAPALQAYIRSTLQKGADTSTAVVALRILNRFGPEALAGLPSDTIAAFYEKAASSRLASSTPDDRKVALQLLESVEPGPGGPTFVAALLDDADASVRIAALRTVRAIGWQFPELFDSVWSRATDPKRSLDERLTAIVTLGANDKPDLARWKALLATDEPLIIHAALRTCRQFAGNEGVRNLLADAATQILKKHPEASGDLGAVLALLGADAERLSAFQLPPATKTLPQHQVQSEMLARLPRSRPRLGQDAFERLGCITCHNVTGAAGTYGPSLKDIGKASTPAAIAESMIVPSRMIKDGFELQYVRTKSGQEMEGWIEQHGADLIVIRGGTERIRVAGADIAERKKLNKSPMPDINLDGVSLEELSDLLAFLVSQGGTLPVSNPASASAPH